MNRLTLIDLNPDKHNQGLPHYPFMNSLNRYNGKCKYKVQM